MQSYLGTSIEAHQNVCEAATGTRTTLNTRGNPFVEEDQVAAHANAPCAQGPCVVAICAAIHYQMVTNDATHVTQGSNKGQPRHKQSCTYTTANASGINAAGRDSGLVPDPEEPPKKNKCSTCRCMLGINEHQVCCKSCKARQSTADCLTNAVYHDMCRFPIRTIALFDQLYVEHARIHAGGLYIGSGR